MVLAAVGVTIALAGAASSDDERVVACVKRANGDVRIVEAETSCRSNEQRVTWSVTGPQGPQGPAGPKGDPGGGAAVPSGPPDCNGDTEAFGAVRGFADIAGMPGESDVRGRENQVELSSVKFCVDAASAPASGGGSGAGKVRVSDVVVTKRVDSASVPLLRAALTGQHIPTVTIDLVRASAQPFTVETIVLTDVLVGSVHSISKGQVPTETVAFRFAKVAVTYRRQRADGSVGQTFTVTYDVATNTTT